jgi:hypothetical protein
MSYLDKLAEEVRKDLVPKQKPHQTKKGGRVPSRTPPPKLCSRVIIEGSFTSNKASPKVCC